MNGKTQIDQTFIDGDSKPQRFLARAAIFVVGMIFVVMSELCLAEEPSIFRRPIQMEISRQFQRQAELLAHSGQLQAALTLEQQAVSTAPFSAIANYNLACLQARNGLTVESLASLKLSIELGFRDAKHLSVDDDLESLRASPEFAELIKEAQTPFERPTPKPAPLEEEIAWVGPENTVWDESTNLLRTAFEWKRPEKEKPIVLEHGEVGELLRKWSAEGTAAGNFGDLYDNCDRDHSNLDYAKFPQLHRIEYRPEVSNEIPFGLQNRFRHDGVVFGNSSTAMTEPEIWRSNPRHAYMNPGWTAILAAQYLQNHLYVYPEHRDHDPGHNGNEGYGDVYPANTPYLLVSQGSSYTDQPFLDALACTLAAFRPDVKDQLVKRGLIAPTLQQIFRSSYKRVRNPDDYFTELAHPSVFDGSQIDALKMIEMAHNLTSETIPPLVQLRVEQEDPGIVGRDYFDIADREHLFDTPWAVARVGRSMQYRRHMTISAQASIDLNSRPLKYKWAVLRGDKSLISIDLLDDNGSRADVTVAWHPRRKIDPESGIESNRVDIGVFAHNGDHWSAPAFVTWFFLDNEERTYDDQGRIRSVAYHGGTDAANYVDPLINTPKTWNDSYRYTEDGRLIGWTRTRGTAPNETSEQFTADGGLVIEVDNQGRAITAREVRYVAQINDEKRAILVELPSGIVWHYGYENQDDLIGKITSREKSEP